MFFAVLVCCIISQALVTTTHASSSKRDTIETETFKYDPHTHVMVAVFHKTCYAYRMSAHEIQDVHTSAGIHAVEARMNAMIDDTTAFYHQMNHQEVLATSRIMASMCNHAGVPSYKLN